MNQLTEIKYHINKFLEIRSDNIVEEKDLKSLIDQAKYALLKKYELEDQTDIFKAIEVDINLDRKTKTCISKNRAYFNLCNKSEGGDVAALDEVNQDKRDLWFVYLVNSVFNEDNNQTGEEILSEVIERYKSPYSSHIDTAIIWALDVDEKSKKKVESLLEGLRNVGK